MKGIVYEFKIGLTPEDKLAAVKESGEAPAEYKRIFAIAEDEDEAVLKAEAYVAKTPYKDIENNKVV